MKTKEKKKSKWKMIAGIMLVIQLLLSLATVGVVLWLNIVPTLYVILLGLSLLLLLIIEYCLFYFGKKKKTGCYVRRTLGVILFLACVIVCVGGVMGGGFQKGDLHLQRAVCQQARQLGLSHDFCRHKVQN